LSLAKGDRAVASHRAQDEWQKVSRFYRKRISESDKQTGFSNCKG
jgi:hypothetical protein